MRFLSFSQPWLWTILHAGKRVENRNWAPPIGMINQQIALHAAKSFDDDAIGFMLRLGIDNFPARQALYPHSLILGVATIDRIVTEPTRLADDQKRWFFGPYGWVLSDVIVLPTPVPQKGAQGLRGLADDVAEAVAAQLEIAAKLASGKAVHA